jgi:hypothetical protein
MLSVDTFTPPLFTDLSNPTSNKIYLQIIYEAVWFRCEEMKSQAGAAAGAYRSPSIITR